MSDGTITKGQYRLDYHINIEDKELLEYFKIISPDVHIYICKPCESKATVRGSTVKSNTSIRMNLNSQQIVEDLKNKYGITNNKIYMELNIPKMSKELIRHFIRGYFDGDGCFTWHTRKPNPKNREKIGV